MPAYQLLVERSAHVVDVESRCAVDVAACCAVIRLNLRVENYLLKHIAKLFLKMLGRALGNGLDRLIGLFNHVL